MTRVFSTQVTAFTVTAGETVVYTVLPGLRVVVLDMELTNMGVDVTHIEVGLKLPGMDTIPFLATSAAPDQPIQWVGRVVMNEGDSLIVTTDGQYACVISGYSFLT
jgi:hypothetical protein